MFSYKCFDELEHIEIVFSEDSCLEDLFSILSDVLDCNSLKKITFTSLYTEDSYIIKAVLSRRKIPCVEFKECDLSLAIVKGIADPGYQITELRLIESKFKHRCKKEFLKLLGESKKPPQHCHYSSREYGRDGIVLIKLQLSHLYQSISDPGRAQYIENLRKSGLQSLTGDFCNYLLNAFPESSNGHSDLYIESSGQSRARKSSQNLPDPFPVVSKPTDVIPLSPMDVDVQPRTSIPDLPNSYMISNRYTCGPILSACIPHGSPTTEEFDKPSYTFGVLGKSKPGGKGKIYSIDFRERLKGSLLTESSPLSRKSKERVTFVYVGRKDHAKVPVEKEGGRVVLVCPRSDEESAKKWVGENRDVLLLDEVQGVEKGQEGLSASRRLAVVLYARALAIRDYIEIDDNLEHFYISPSLVLSKEEVQWSHIYELFRDAAKKGKAGFISARTHRPIYGYPRADKIEMMEESAIGSKITFTKCKVLRKKIRKDEMSLLLPKKKDVWGEDIWKWRMLCRKGISTRVLDHTVMQFSRSKGGVRGVCAKSLSQKAAYWLSKDASELYCGMKKNSLEYATYEDLKMIVEKDKNQRTKELTDIDSLPTSNERTEERLQKLKAYANDYQKVVKELFELSADETHLLKIIKEKNGCFGLGLLPGDFFTRAERWMGQEWKGIKKWVATPEVKIRLIAEAVRYLGYELKELEENYNNYKRAKSSVSKKISDLYDLLKKEFPRFGTDFSPGVRVPSDDALKTFFRLKKLEIETFQRDERPSFPSKIVPALVMEVSGYVITFETVRLTFDKEQRMTRITSSSRDSAAKMFKDIGVQAKEIQSRERSHYLVVDNLEDVEKFLDHLMNKKLKINGEDVLILPVELVQSQQSGLKRFRETSYSLIDSSSDSMNDSLPRKKRKVHRQSIAPHSTTRGEVLGLPSGTSEAPAVSKTAPSSVQSKNLPGVSTSGFLFSGFGFFQSAIEKVLKRTQRALWNQKMQNSEASSVSDIKYKYAEKTQKIETGDIALEVEERAFVLKGLTEYQEESIHKAELCWKAGLKGFLLANDMGTGKTLIMIELMFRRLIKKQHVLFLAPDAILGQLRSQILKQLSDLIIGAVKSESMKLVENKTLTYHQKSGCIAALKKMLTTLKGGIKESDIIDSEKEKLSESIEKNENSLLNIIKQLRETYNYRGYNESITDLGLAREKGWVTNPLIFCDPFKEVKIFNGKIIRKNASELKIGTITIASIKQAKKLSETEWDFVVCDEASQIHNRDADVYKEFSKICEKTPKVLLATGTPIENNMDELVALIHLLIDLEERKISHEAEMTRRDFLKKAKQAFEDMEDLYIETKGVISEDEFVESLSSIVKSFLAEEIFKEVTKHLFYRVAKTEDKVSRAFEGAVPREIVYKRHVNLEEKHLEKVENRYKVYKDGEGSGIEKNFLKVFGQAQKLLIHPEFEKWMIGNSDEYNENVKKYSAKFPDWTEEKFNEFVNQSNLLKKIVDDLETEEFLKKGQLVVFVESVAVGHVLNGILSRKFGKENSVFMFGESDTSSKTETQKKFENNEIKAIVTTFKTGGMGVDLKNGNALMIVERPFNPGVELQAKARINRVGKRGDIHLYEYITNSSVDAHLKAIRGRKEGLAAYVFNERKKEGRTISFDREVLSESNIQERLSGFLDVLISLKDFQPPFNRDSNVLRILKERFIELADKKQLLQFFSTALPHILKIKAPIPGAAIPAEDLVPKEVEDSFVDFFGFEQSFLLRNLEFSRMPESLSSGASSARIPIPGGVEYGGNTCYLASCMQLLAHIQLYTDLFNSAENPLKIKDGEDDATFKQRLKIQEQGFFIVQKIRCGQLVSRDEIDTFRKSCFEHKYDGNESVIASLEGQEDAAEVMFKILKVLGYTEIQLRTFFRDDVMDSAKYEDATAFTSEKKERNAEEYSFLDQIQKYHVDGNLTLSIPFDANNEMVSIEELIKNHWKDEKLTDCIYKSFDGEGGEVTYRKYKRVQRSKSLGIESPSFPKVLKITIQQQENLKVKVSSGDFIYPSGHEGQGPRYRLVAILEHKSHGHYIAHLKSSQGVVTADDNTVSRSTQETFAGTEYFYELCVEGD